LEFFIDIKSFRSHYSPGVDSASNRNEYQEHFLGVKSGRCVRLKNLPPSCTVVMKSGNLNFLEHSGPLQACNGTALSLLTIVHLETQNKRIILVQGFVLHCRGRSNVTLWQHSSVSESGKSKELSGLGSMFVYFSKI